MRTDFFRFYVTTGAAAVTEGAAALSFYDFPDGGGDAEDDGGRYEDGCQVHSFLSNIYSALLQKVSLISGF